MEKKDHKERTRIVSPSLRKVSFKNGFLGQRVHQNTEVIIPYQWEALNDRVPGAPQSHALENLRIAAGLSQGEFQGLVFQDSDVAKWLEAVSYSLEHSPKKQLKCLAEEVIELVTHAQWPDGYLNSYFTLKGRDRRWTNLRDNHELYCAGHWIEAGVAHFEATGKRTLLDCVCRLADHIASIFGPEPYKKRGYPGHPEIELALIKLYRATQKRAYLELNRFFVEERGKTPLYFEVEAQERVEEKTPWPFWSPEYCQAHLPVREQKEAVGHAVRAMYLYSAMVDLAWEGQDELLLATCRDLWHSVTKQQMHITGGIGSSAKGESFTFDYDLPPDRSYNETCAGIGLFLWAHRMLEIEKDSQYADVMERVLFNGILSGVSLEGKRYFYVNPLEVWPKAVSKRADLNHVVLTRQPWLSCACCPPNLARLLASLGRYLYGQDGPVLYVHLFENSSMTTTLQGEEVTLVQETDYPWKEEIQFHLKLREPVQFTIAIRLPGWCSNSEFWVNDRREIPPIIKGYAHFTRTWSDGDTIFYRLPMPIERTRAHPQLRYVQGKAALTRGPLVYCVEEVDNGTDLSQLVLPRNFSFDAQFEPQTLGGVVILQGKAFREEDFPSGEVLYSKEKPSKKEVFLRAVPYYTWGNRGEGEMLVWIREE